jgi:hypothetical protein
MSEEQNQFKRTVKRYLEIRDREERIKDELKTMKDEKDNLENSILQFIEENEYQDRDIVVGDFKMKYTRTKQTETITKKYLFDKLITYFQNDENKTKEVIDYLYNERESSTKVSLKVNSIKKEE